MADQPIDIRTRINNAPVSQPQRDPGQSPEPPTAMTPGQTPPSDPRTELAAVHRDTRHIADQTDRIAAHLLEGQTTAQRHAARTLLAQIEQITRNQALLISLVEELHQRLPPQGETSRSPAPQIR